MPKRVLFPAQLPATYLSDAQQQQSSHHEQQQTCLAQFSEFLAGIRGDALGIRKMINENLKLHADAQLESDATDETGDGDDRTATKSACLDRWLSLVFWTLCNWCDVVLRGVGQVYLVSSPVTGLLFVVGLAVSKDPMRAVFAILGSLFATIGGGFAIGGNLLDTAPSAQAAGGDVLAGLYGYDGCLTALAINVFLKPRLDVIIDRSNDAPSVPLPSIAQSYGAQILCTIILSFVTGCVFRKAFARLFSLASIPPCTAAFNATLLVLLFALRSSPAAFLVCYDAVGLGQVSTESPNLYCNFNVSSSSSSSAPSCVAEEVASAADIYSLSYSVMWVDACILGVGQLIFADTRAASLLIIAGLCFSSLNVGVQAVLGSVLGNVFAFGFAGWPSLTPAEVLVRNCSSSASAASAAWPSARQQDIVTAKAAKILALANGLLGYNACAVCVVVFGESRTYSERIELRDLFTSLDRDGSCTLSRQQMKVFVERLFILLERTKQREQQQEQQQPEKEKKEASATKRAVLSWAEFDSFFDEVTHADPDYITLDEFSCWIAAEGFSNIVVEGEATTFATFLDAVVYAFVAALLQPYVSAAITSPFPVLTLPFNVASWLRKLARASPIPPAARAPASVEATPATLSPVAPGSGSMRRAPSLVSTALRQQLCTRSLARSNQQQQRQQQARSLQPPAMSPSMSPRDAEFALQPAAIANSGNEARVDRRRGHSPEPGSSVSGAVAPAAAASISHSSDQGNVHDDRDDHRDDVYEDDGDDDSGRIQQRNATNPLVWKTAFSSN